MDKQKVFRNVLIALWIYLGLAFVDKLHLVSRVVGGPTGFQLRATWDALSQTVWGPLFWLAVTGTISYLLWR